MVCTGTSLWFFFYSSFEIDHFGILANTLECTSKFGTSLLVLGASKKRPFLMYLAL